MATFFNEFFGVTTDQLDAHGAFNISVINDMPLFIDPFLLFNSKKPEYRQLHDDILRYMMFLRDAVIAGRITPDLEKAWFLFPEVKQNWLGFSLHGNGGSGLGHDFASALKQNLETLFADFGAEKVTKGSHLEKVCLVQSGVGRDMISDFTTNLIKHWLCKYTEQFALAHIEPALRKKVWIAKSRFNYELEVWEREQFELPCLDGDFVLLTPKDLLTKDENWINKPDMIHDFESIPASIPDAELRGQVFNFFERALARKDDKRPTTRDRAEAAVKTIINFPQLIDYYIRLKEQTGDKATDISTQKVLETKEFFETQVRALQAALLGDTEFYDVKGLTYEEVHRRLAYLKDVIENKGGHKLFYHKGVAIQRESDLQILFRFVWFGSPLDVGAEVNDGRGPVDYKISFGAKDKTLVEMKLAKNTALERNLEKQLPIYQAASDAKHGIKAIMFFSAQEKQRLDGILDKLGILGHKDVVVIDARNDNKPSGSKAA
ncbi:hypothetical protein [Sinorhizobium meliloti]|uniref:hypothetical protein n=1 Tax=Rhizobium meliloti TaxID=382 RepID=UPI000FE132C6|nr:hypothetical protein [Sinorhizobium meliloti]RVL94722.1 hypothetical protein CN136_21645 [Sinorhizobium meliloti]